MYNNPKLFELNTRVWLKSFGDGAKLSSITDKQINLFKDQGIDLIWLMGIWKTNESIIEEYCFEPELVASYGNALRDWKKEDIIGSPYAIDTYEVNPALGNKEDLIKLKEKLNSKGIKLILDFVCNHFSVKSSLLEKNKDIFLPADEFIYKNDPYTFFKSHLNKNEYFAHGRDPLFPPWKDTIQVNFYNPGARKYLTQTLLELTKLCDGVRCDMAMLPLNNIFFNTWIGVLKKYGYELPKKEFWEEAITTVKNKSPEFLFIAETYWDLEWQLQQLGFDFTYDKKLTDRLAAGDIRTIKDHLHAEYDYQKKSVHFLENHDEDRAVVKFGKEKSLAAAVVISTIQGMVLYYQGQFEGRKIKLPVQLGREPVEKLDNRIHDFYLRLLKATNQKIFKQGNWRFIEPLSVGGNDSTMENLLAWEWRFENEVRIVVVNFNNSTSRCRLKFNVSTDKEEIILEDLLNENTYNRSVSEILQKGLFIELKSFNSHIFAFTKS